MLEQPYVTIADVPVGYTVPTFPSLYWPLGNENYAIAYLYYLEDIWRFTLYWTVLFFGAFYGVAGLWAMFVNRKPTRTVWIAVVYTLFGAIQGVISATVVGLTVAAIYGSGSFAMSTWIPMCAGVSQILFNVVTAYSLMSGIL